MAVIPKLRSSQHAALKLKPVLSYGDYPTACLVTQHTTAATTADSPDITLEQVPYGKHDLEVYIYDIACFSNEFKAHLIIIRTVLTRLCA